MVPGLGDQLPAPGGFQAAGTVLGNGNELNDRNGNLSVQKVNSRFRIFISGNSSPTPGNAPALVTLHTLDNTAIPKVRYVNNYIEVSWVDSDGSEINLNNTYAFAILIF